MSTRLLASFLLALGAGAAQAAAGTASLDGWSVAGDAVAQGGTLTLTTAFLADGDPDAPFNLSGQAAADIALVEATAGVAAYGLDLAPPDVGVEGSAIAQTFSAAAGQRLSFTWSFTTQEDLFLDHAFAVVNGQVYTLATRADAPAGPQRFSLLLPGGTVTLTLGVVDTGDVLGVSSLSIGHLEVSAVPEPGPAALLLAGLAALAWRRRTPA